MASEWRTLPFDQAVEVNPPVPLIRGETYPFVDMQSLNPSLRKVPPSENRQFLGNGTRFQHGDTLMARITPCLENGKIAQFYSPVAYSIGHGSTEFIVIRGKDGVSDNDFAYYLTRSDIVHKYAISQMTGTSGRQRVPVAALSHLEIKMPPLSEQRAIAHILGTLDDKIELNRRMNATLEAIARAIFKSWFVDFDPVHAKARGEQPSGMDAETAALFPDAFEDSALGPIPRGWGVNVLDNLVEIISGGTPKTSVSEYWNGDIPWFSVKDVPAEGDVFVISTEKTITEAGVANSSANILPFGTTIISARGTVGKLALVGVPMAMNQSCYGIRGKISGSDYHAYFLLKSVVAVLQKNTHGTVFDTITRKTFSGVRTLVPPESVIYAFETTVTPLLRRVRRNLYESRTLAELRDALLPRLISGEMRVSDQAYNRQGT